MSPNRLLRRWEAFPVPQFFPAPLLEPREAGCDVGHVQDGSEGFCFHGRKDSTVLVAASGGRMFLRPCYGLSGVAMRSHGLRHGLRSGARFAG